MGWPVVLNHVRLVRGDGRTIRLRFWSDEAHTAPVDMTPFGSTWTAQVRPTPDDDIFADLEVDATSAATGVIVVTVPSTAWAAIYGTVSSFDVQVSGGVVSPVTIVRGHIDIEKDITH